MKGLFLKFKGKEYEVIRRLYQDGTMDIEVLSDVDVPDMVQDWAEREYDSGRYDDIIRSEFADE
jgi:hypothetical protein